MDFSHFLSGWFSNLFSSGESVTVTTVKPQTIDATTEQSSDGKKWLELLTAHMVTMQAPTASTMNHTNILKRVKYDDYQILRLIPSTHAQLEFLREYKETADGENVHWLKGPAMRYFVHFYSTFFFFSI